VQYHNKDYLVVDPLSSQVSICMLKTYGGIVLQLP